MKLRAYYLFDKTGEDYWLCHARTGREAKRLFWRELEGVYEDVWFPDVRVLRAPRYDARSAMFDKPTFDDDARPDCDKCGRWECPGGEECKGEEW